ncbi:MAG TPA: beta-galactosidase [Lachnospiraceae bacterium]|nr:beta-galactosidase [Lachnospiraceae bacterium]
MKEVLSKFPKMLHGGDYNPDQWLDYPEIFEEDIVLMKQAKVNCVSLAIFAWATLEPEEGIYNFGWLDHIINRLYQEGIYTILATPTGAMPNWLTNRYEEVLQMQSNLVRNLPGKRHNFCYTSPVMRKKTREIDTELAKRFGNHDGVILWHLSNELGGNGTDASCHCPLCQEAFREWLKAKYKDLDTLNHAWWTKFWSHTYTDWNQIHSPVPHGENLLHGLTLDWKRFVSHQIQDFCEEEARTVKQFSNNLPVTTNMMDFFQPLDYPKFGSSLDVISWDSYPNWHRDKDEVNVAVATAANHNIMRSIKKAPFLLMESTPSITNWKPVNTQKRPGLHELASMQAVAHGSNSVQYFQWRKSRGSFEKFHGAVVGHDGTGNTRVFKEVTKLGDRLQRITDAVYNTCNKPEVAIIFDWENWWAIDDAAAIKQNPDYVATLQEHYKPFWELGVDVDIVDMDQSYENYKLLIAPMTYMLKAGFIEKVKAFVENGGTFVTTYWSGLVDETDLCFIKKQPLQEVLGLLSEEIDVINENYPNTVTYLGKTFKVKDLCDVVRLLGAEALADYNEDYLAGMPALTRNRYGKGTAYYIASRNEEAFQKEFYQTIIKESNITQNLGGNLPYGVTVTKRCGDRDLLFVQNFNSSKCKVTLDKEYEILETGEKVSGEFELMEYECCILV